MNKLEKLHNLVERIKKTMISKNNVNFIPRQTLSVNINNQTYYISLICDDNFQVQVVMLDEQNNIINKILDIEGDRASITIMQNFLYVFTANEVCICDINNLNASPTVLNLGNLDIQGVCSNQNNIFAYSIAKDRIIKYDKNLMPVQEYENPYSKEKPRVSIELACNQENFFSIPIMLPTEEQYISMKIALATYLGKEEAELNDSIHSCSYNDAENTLYISMYNIILIIKGGTEFSYLYFKDNAITTSFYDNNIKQLIINFGGTKGNHVVGSIIKLSDREIKEKAKNITETISASSEGLNNSPLSLMGRSSDESAFKR